MRASFTEPSTLLFTSLTKLPKAFVFVDQIVRSPSGKADYRWAKQVAEDAISEGRSV